jgi:hypothetical protein
MADEFGDHHICKNVASRRAPELGCARCYTEGRGAIRRNLDNINGTAMPDTLNILAITCAAIGALFLFAALFALRRRRYFRTLGRLVFSLFWVALALLFGAVSLGVQGYRAFTREEVVATVRVEPTGEQRFQARIHFADGHEANYDLAGDEFSVDAHVLKWKAVANLFGLHTAYELDRVAGRYRSIEQERDAVRTVFLIAEERPVDLFGLRQRYALLAPLLDVEYGSATFVPAAEPADYEVRVSTTGLMARRLPATGM